MIKNLVIVESPTKASTLSQYLGADYRIVASMGHMRDLPRGEFGVDTEKNFEQKYVIPKEKIKSVNALVKEADTAENLWMATDPDREGEAIAWNIVKVIEEKGKIKNKKYQRVAFHEITEEAIKEAFQNPRRIDLRLVDAQQARRVLDRLVGYNLSPILWKKVKSGLSAGRVQSVALKLIVEREKGIGSFNSQEYWSVEAQLETASQNKEARFTADLVQLKGKRLEIKNKSEAEGHVRVLEKALYNIAEISKKEVKRYPSPPFTTSTLQQTASNKLGFTSKKTMMLAQNLYENGLITYMRTDSVNLAPIAISVARQVIKAEYGDKYLPTGARVFKTKSKSAQEAHEAIRPTDATIKSLESQIMEGMTRDHLRLYDLIWKRMVSSQMSEAVLEVTTVNVSAKSESIEYLLRATGSVVKFDGWLKVYGQNDQDEDQQEEKTLPNLDANQQLKLIELIPSQHFTEPPARYTEASLIKKLEELGIGRPSTYAPTLSTIQERYY